MFRSLDRIETELVAAARRLERKQRTRRRSFRGAAAAISAILIVSGGSAIAGVGPLAPTERDPSNVMPRLGDPEVTLGHVDAGGKTWRVRAFLGEQEAICLQVPALGQAPVSMISAQTCQPIAAAAQVLARGEATSITLTQVPSRQGAEAMTLVAGVVADDATRVTVTDMRSKASRDATLSATWTAAGATNKVFVADLPQTDRGEPAKLQVTTQTSTGAHVVRWPESPTP